MMRRLQVFVLALLLMSTSVVALPGVALADESSVIDFEGLAEGMVVSVVSAGAGISGDDAGGSVGVSATNPALIGNQAMIFDGECSGGCSGGDIDLEFPGHGNILIVSEDGDSADPDDADLVGTLFEFDFSTWGPGVVRVDSIDLGDIEAVEPGAQITLFSGGPGGVLEGTIPIPATGNNSIQTFAVGLSGIDFMRVTLNGSGAIDNIRVTVLEETASARVTGGGSQLAMIGSDGDRVRVTRGFTLHCDITLSNNLEINWPGGNQWHIDKFVDDAFCEDNPAFEPNPPTASADTYVGLDSGRLNNVEGSVACWVFEDHGEPGSLDRAMIHVWEVGFDPGITDLSVPDPCGTEAGPNTVLFVEFSEIAGGNIQFHEDQPHN